MTRKMKILIGYDGTKGADLALNDLRRAGLPHEAEALVISVAARSVLQSSPGSLEMIIARDSITGIEKARTLAEKAVGRIRSDFPGWSVEEAVVSGSPSGALIVKAEEWGADLLVVGSHGHTTLGRFSHGSGHRVAKPASLMVYGPYRPFLKRRKCMNTSRCKRRNGSQERNPSRKR